MTTLEQHNQTIEQQVQEMEQSIRARMHYTCSKNYEIDRSEQDKQANCIGFTLIGSKALEAAGIEHSIMFGGTHATIIRPAGERIMLTDFTAPNLDTDITDDLIEQGQQAYKRTLAMLDTSSIIVGSGKDWITTINQYGWLVQNENNLNDPRNQYIPVSIFSVQNGRRAIYGQQKFTEAYYRKDLVAAAKELIALGPLFPNRDIQSEFHTQVKKTVRQLAAAHNFELAETVARVMYEESDLGNNSRVREHYADCLRYVARYSGQGSIASRALHLYRIARDNPRPRANILRPKIAECEQLQLKGATT